MQRLFISKRDVLALIVDYVLGSVYFWILYITFCIPPPVCIHFSADRRLYTLLPGPLNCRWIPWINSALTASAPPPPNLLLRQSAQFSAGTRANGSEQNRVSPRRGCFKFTRTTRRRATPSVSSLSPAHKHGSSLMRLLRSGVSPATKTAQVPAALKPPPLPQVASDGTARLPNHSPAPHPRTAGKATVGISHTRLRKTCLWKLLCMCAFVWRSIMKRQCQVLLLTVTSPTLP